MKTWLSFLVTLITIYSANADQEVLAASAVCYSGTDYSESTLFNAPQDGSLKAVRLQHKSGKVTCDYEYDEGVKSEEGFWGCGPEYYDAINIMKVTDTSLLNGVTLYPTKEYVTGDGLPYLATCQTSRCEAAARVYSVYNQGIGNNAAQSVKYSGPTYSVSTSDQFMLQLGWAYCPGSTTNPFNIDGSVCADVYFVYTDNPLPPANTDYYISSATFSWDGAETYCLNKYRTNLAKITSDRMNNDAQALCRTGGSTPCWIGASDILRYSKQYISGTWTDGTNYDSKPDGYYMDTQGGFITKKAETNTATMLTGGGNWYQRTRDNAFRALCNKPDDVKTKYCCTAKDATNKREVSKCNVSEEVTCGKKDFCKFVGCDTFGYCSAVTSNIFDQAVQDPCKGKYTQSDCEAVGCQWDTGNPPDEYLDDDMELNKANMVNGNSYYEYNMNNMIMIVGALFVVMMICGFYSCNEKEKTQGIDSHIGYGSV